jgi:hypothetical protein
MLCRQRPHAHNSCCVKLVGPKDARLKAREGVVGNAVVAVLNSLAYLFLAGFFLVGFFLPPPAEPPPGLPPPVPKSTVNGNSLLSLWVYGIIGVFSSCYLKFTFASEFGQLDCDSSECLVCRGNHRRLPYSTSARDSRTRYQLALRIPGPPNCFP